MSTATANPKHSSDVEPPEHGTVTEDAHTIMIHSVSWGAIFAGVVVALVIQILLSMLGAGIGLATMQAAYGPEGSTLSIWAGVWLVVSAMIATFIGGYIAARMSGRTTPTTGALHGLTAWAFSTLLVFYLLTTAVGSIFGGAFSGIASVAGGLGQTISQSAGPAVSSINPLEMIDRQVRATGGDPEALNQSAVNAISALVTGGEDRAEEARAEAVEALAAARGVPEAEAREQVARIEAQFQTAVQRTTTVAERAADTTASVVSTGALVAFAGLVLGAIAGWLGGRSGVVHPVLADRLAPAAIRRARRDAA